MRTSPSQALRLAPLDRCLFPQKDTRVFDKSIRILIVDDMPTIRELVKNGLKSMGYTTFYEAGDGESALNSLKEKLVSGEPIQLVISDWNMPKKNGFELLKECRSNPNWKDLPFVLLTSESEKGLVTDAIMAGVSQYIVKPFTAKIFEEKLKSAYQKHFPTAGK